jgi:hypothetical protein
MPVLTFQEQSFELLEAGICRASAISLRLDSDEPTVDSRNSDGAFSCV